MGVIVHALRAVVGRDVAEPAFLSAGYLRCRRLGRQPVDQCAKVSNEPVVQSFCRYADCVVLESDLPPEFKVPVLLQRLGDRVQVNHLITWLRLALESQSVRRWL